MAAGVHAALLAAVVVRAGKGASAGACLASLLEALLLAQRPKLTAAGVGRAALPVGRVAFSGRQTAFAPAEPPDGVYGRLLLGGLASCRSAAGRAFASAGAAADVAACGLRLSALAVSAALAGELVSPALRRFSEPV